MDDKLVQALIKCEKVITVKPRKEMQPDKRNQYIMRNDFSCESTDKSKRFDVFFRYNTIIPHLFSIGLRYHSNEGSVILCRYNGKHEHKNKIADHQKFDDFHIHHLYDKQLSDETSNMLDAKITDRYITFDQALLTFLVDCNIKNWQSVFPDLESKVNQVSFEGM